MINCAEPAVPLQAVVGSITSLAIAVNAQARKGIKPLCQTEFHTDTLTRTATLSGAIQRLIGSRPVSTGPATGTMFAAMRARSRHESVHFPSPLESRLRGTMSQLRWGKLG